MSPSSTIPKWSALGWSYLEEHRHGTHHRAGDGQEVHADANVPLILGIDYKVVNICWSSYLWHERYWGHSHILYRHPMYRGRVHARRGTQEKYNYCGCIPKDRCWDDSCRLAFGPLGTHSFTSISQSPCASYTFQPAWISEAKDMKMGNLE